MAKIGRQGEGGGKQPKFASQDAFVKKALSYFTECDGKRVMPNKAGMRVYLQISGSTYSEYKGKYPKAIKALEDYIENAWVQRLAGNAPTGAIFYLKNAFKDDYREKQEVDHTTGGKPFVLPGEIINKNNLSGTHPGSK